MSVQLTARLVLTFSSVLREGAASYLVDEQSLCEFYFGVGDAQADWSCIGAYTIAASGTKNIDFNDWMDATPPSEFLSVKGLYVRNDSQVGGASVQIGGSFSVIAGCQTALPPRGAVVFVNPTADGWDTSVPNSILQITNLSASVAASVRVAAIGVRV
jgi:hypothetical protein